VHSLYLQTILRRARITQVRARTASQTADNVTVTWQTRTSECKAPSQKEKAKRRRDLEAAWVTMRQPKKLLVHGGRAVSCGGEEREHCEGAAKPSPTLAPIPTSAYLEGDTGHREIEGFGRPTEPFPNTLPRSLGSRGAALLGQSRYLPFSSAQTSVLVTKFAHI